VVQGGKYLSHLSTVPYLDTYLPNWYIGTSAVSIKKTIPVPTRYLVPIYQYGISLPVPTIVFTVPLSQVFLRHGKTLPREDVKVLLGDNLAAHLSPYVLGICEKYNIRFVLSAVQVQVPYLVTVPVPTYR
jgi:hypothetical protein